MSGELENIRQLVTKLDEVQIDLETVKEGLDKNFENYKNISDISSNISEKNQEVLESINTLQIQATQTVETAIEKATNLKIQMGKYYSAEYTQTKKDFDALMSDIQSELSTLKSTIETTIQDAVNDVNIDTADLAKIIDKKIGKLDLSKVDRFIAGTNDNIDKAIKNMAQKMSQVEQIDGILQSSIKSLDQTANKINNATESFNGINKSVSMAMTLSMLFVGIVIGAGVMTYLKIDATSDFYFSQYEQKQIKLEADQKEIKAKLDTLTAFEKWIISNNYKLNFGKFDDSNQNYISIDKSTHAKCKGWKGYNHDVLQDHAYIATSKNLVVCFD
ncbi:MAG TPA: hypothetical protein EYG74_07730 [Sulfurimonas autotrophica]|nr:hypothetical protein [Sulfurimonas autotrophica]